MHVHKGGIFNLHGDCNKVNESSKMFR
jgi:hypothetical protein